jgi:hypothetical protein
MQLEIEEHHRKIKEQQDRMMNFVAKKTGPSSGRGPASVETGIPLLT